MPEDEDDGSDWVISEAEIASIGVQGQCRSLIFGVVSRNPLFYKNVIPIFLLNPFSKILTKEMIFVKNYPSRHPTKLQLPSSLIIVKA